MSLGNNLRRIRKEKGLSQTQLSEMAGIRVAHISKLENDDGDPKLSTLYKLMGALQCSADGLLMDKDNVGLSSVLKVMMERIDSFPEEDKKTVIRMIHYYSQGLGEELRLTKNKTWFKEFVHGDAVESPLPE